MHFRIEYWFKPQEKSSCCVTYNNIAIYLHWRQNLIFNIHFCRYLINFGIIQFNMPECSCVAVQIHHCCVLRFGWESIWSRNLSFTIFHISMITCQSEPHPDLLGKLKASKYFVFHGVLHKGIVFQKYFSTEKTLHLICAQFTFNENRSMNFKSHLCLFNFEKWYE